MVINIMTANGKTTIDTVMEYCIASVAVNVMMVNGKITRYMAAE
jgi:hypothetical protein